MEKIQLLALVAFYTSHVKGKIGQNMGEKRWLDYNILSTSAIGSHPNMEKLLMGGASLTSTGLLAAQ
jgi:hypothetical protein